MTPEAADRSADLELALRLADAADAISLPRFGASDLRVDAKPDLTPVTDADLAVETELRRVLAAERPADRVLGEEFAGGDESAGERSAGDESAGERYGGGEARGEQPGGDGAAAEQGADRLATGLATGTGTVAGSGRCWVIDPIDGTKNFVRGVPVWATLISLLVDGRPVLGVVSAPALARRWWAAEGFPALTRFAGGPQRRCRVSAIARIQDASLSLSDLTEWEDAGLGDAMHALSRSCWRSRGYGDFYSYMLVAEGAVDIAAEPELNLWDLAALAPIVTAAGGAFTAIDGSPVGPATASALATNGPLHAAVVSALSGNAPVTTVR